MSAHHGRDQVQTLTLAADKDGTVTGFKVHLDADLGAYISLVGGGIPVLGAFMFNAIYKFPAYRFECQTVLTEHHLDRRLPRRRPAGGDVRDRADDGRAGRGGRRGPARDPRAQLDHARGVPVHHGGRASSTTPATTRQATAQAKESFGYDALRAEQKERRDRGDRVQLGIGVSTFTEMCGLAPSRVLGSLDYGAGGWEHAGVRMLATGKVEVVTGTSAHGQGHETAFSQIVADRLGVPFEDVEVLHGDTQVAHRGLDTYGSRSLVVGGEALVQAVDKVIDKAKHLASHLLEANRDDLDFSDGRFTVRGTDQGIAIQELATATFTGHNYPDDMELSIDAEATYDPVNFNYPHGTHLCAMEVDTETGAVKMRKYTCCDDIGTIINPLIVAGQVHGGLVQGIAQALWEEAVHDEAGTLVQRLVRRLPAAHLGRHDLLRRRPRRRSERLHHQLARHQGRRRGGHHRLHPGGRQRGRRRRTPPRRLRHPDALHPRARVARHRGQQGRGSDGDTPGRDAALRRKVPSTRTARTEQASDPGAVRLPRPDVGRGGARRARPARRRREDHGRRAEPAAGPADAAQRPGGRHRPRRHLLAAGHPRRRRRPRDRRDDHPPRRARRQPGQGARAPAVQGRRGGRGLADPAPRHLRRRAGARRPRR